jgi:peptidoglycan/LPS O-acetylase OafA/YrhL
MEVGVTGITLRADRASDPASGTARLHWIDWLRVGAIAGVFVFHTLRPFDATDWHVKNAETDALLGTSQIFVATFGPAVLFLLAGAGVRFALRRRTPRAFLGERTARLLVPFVVGTLLLSPIQAAIERAHDGRAVTALPDFVGWWSAAPGAILDRGVTPAVFGFGYHLWFLGFLFAFSVIGLPICAALRRPRGVEALRAIASRVARWPGATLLGALPIAVLMLALAPLGTDEHDWAEFGWFFGYFLIGYVLLADERFLPAVRRDLRVILMVAAASTAALIGLDFVAWYTDPTRRGLDLRSLATLLVFVLEGWAWTLVVLNLAMRFARLQRPVAPRLGDAVLPIYVLHQPVILAVAFLVVPWPVGIVPKWLAVFGISAIVTLGFIELALRAPLTRVLLGARVRSAAPAGPAGDGAAGRPSIAAPPTGVHDARPG